MSDELTLAELMGARFCHDLAGPISAISNGIEFLQEENEEMRVRALELVEASSQEAVFRLQFLRQAYGFVPLEGETNLSHLKTLAENFFSTSKISLDWPDQHTEASGISLGHRMGRLILNLMIITASSLIHGGTLKVRLTKLDGGKRIIVSGEGKDIKASPDIAAILGGKEKPMDKRNVQIHFTAQLAKQLGINVQVSEQDDGLQLTAECMKMSSVREEITAAEETHA